MVVATVEFEAAASAQARALGFDPALVFVPHPIQNRTAEELRAIADDVVAHLLSMLGSATHDPQPQDGDRRPPDQEGPA